MREVIIFSEDDIVNMLRGEEITLRDGSHQHTFVVENTTSLYTNVKKTPNQIRKLAGLEPVKELELDRYHWNYEYKPGTPLSSDILAFFDTIQSLGLRVFNDETPNVNGFNHWSIMCNSLVEFDLVNCIFSLWGKEQQK